MRARFLCLVLGMLLLAGTYPDAFAQLRQKPDLDFVFTNADPAYAPGSGPLITLSETNSAYVLNGSMDPFVRLAETDGFRVVLQTGDISSSLAETSGILVIANPFVAQYRDLPAMTPPSAFSEEEIEAIHDWVEAGGSLLVLADHAPFGGGSSALASRFGFEYLNGHAAETALADTGYSHVNIEYTPTHGLDSDHPITNGDTGRKRIDRFFCFGGQAFIPPPEARQILTIPDGWSAIFTYRLKAEIQTALRIDASGMAQGATLEYGKGRIALFGEAGGFTAQVIDGTKKFGFNTPEGAENPEFVLATLRWLVRYSPP